MNNIMSSMLLINPNQIIFHETQEDIRLNSICNSIQQEGFIKNPPIVLKLNDNYLLLDGAHRTKALISLGCRRIPVQVVPEKDIQLSSWSHLLSIDTWWYSLKESSYISWSRVETAQKCLVKVTEPSGNQWFLYKDTKASNQLSEIDMWHHIVEMYQYNTKIKRVTKDTMIQLNSNEVLLSYPKFLLEDLKKIVGAGRIMPAGVTRTLIKNRLLNLQIPLNILKVECCVREKWDSFCQDRAINLRSYSEPVLILE